MTHSRFLDLFYEYSVTHCTKNRLQLAWQPLYTITDAYKEPTIKLIKPHCILVIQSETLYEDVPAWTPDSQTY